MNTNLRTLFEQRRLRIGVEPLERMIQRLDGADSATTYDDEQGIPQSRTVVVDEPPRLLQVDAFCQSLSPTATVVIPFSEDPAFDFLKSRLKCHGMIGAHAPHSPHQIWWGGLLPAKPANGYLSVSQAHLVSSIRRDTPEDAAAAHFTRALDALNISYSIERGESDVDYDYRPELRSRLLLDAWTGTDKPLIWLDPQCTGDPSALSLDLRGADFAATQTPDAKLSTNFLYFGRSSATFELLKNWNKLCEEFQELPAHHLLDATWALIASQRSLLTVWVPPYKGPEINHTVHDSSALPPQAEMPQLSLHDPVQRHARRAQRTSAPEPQCVLNSRFGGRDTLTLVIQSEFALAHETAATMESAVDAFFKADGGFSVLGIIICSNDGDVAEVTRKITEGWFLRVASGVILEPNAFQALSAQALSDGPAFVMQHSCGQRLTANGTSVHVTRCQAVFSRAAPLNGINQPNEPARPPLKLISR